MEKEPEHLKSIDAIDYHSISEEAKQMHNQKQLELLQAVIPQKQPSWLKIKIWTIKEWWYAYTKAKYFIQRYQVNPNGGQLPDGTPVGVVEWTKYLVQESKYPYSYTWQEKPVYCYKPLWTVLIIKKLNKQHPEFKHAAIDIRQYHWLDQIMNGPISDQVVGTGTTAPIE